MQVVEWAFKFALAAVLAALILFGIRRSEPLPAEIITAQIAQCDSQSHLIYQITATEPIRLYRLLEVRATAPGRSVGLATGVVTGSIAVRQVLEARFQRTAQLNELICDVPELAVRSGSRLVLQVQSDGPRAEWRTVSDIMVR